MNDSNLINIVSQATLFQDLELATCQEIISQGRRLPLQVGKNLFMQGDEADLFYIVVTGHVRLVQVNPEGHQFTVNYVSAGGGIGIIVALSHVTYPVTAEVVQEGEALAWRRDNLRHLMLKYPQLAINGLSIMSQYFIGLQTRYHELSAERVERRVARALLRLVRQVGRKTVDGILVDLPLSRQDLAEMTGTTLFTVSRILSQWEDAGFVLAEREKVTLRDPHALVIIAEDLPDSQISI